MDTPMPAAEPLRSPVLVAALLAVPGAAYTAWALVTRRGDRAAWAVVVATAAAALAWLVSPAGVALTTATLD